MDAGIVAAVGVQHGPLVEGHEIRVKAGQGDALVRQLALPLGANRLAESALASLMMGFQLFLSSKVI